MNTTMSPERSEPLRDALHRMADDLARQAPGEEVPAAVWAALQHREAPAATQRTRPASRWRFAWAGVGLAAATLMGAVMLLASTPRDGIQPHAQASLATPFLPLATPERFAEVMRGARDQGLAWVVPTELPSESLPAMGLPYDPARAGESVRAELLVHASGDVLAVRFVR
jgi:hypothetical protein